VSHHCTDTPPPPPIDCCSMKKRQGSKRATPDDHATSLETEATCETGCSCEPKPPKRGRVNAELLAVTSPRSVEPTTPQILFTPRAAELSHVKHDNVQLAVWRRLSAPQFVHSLSDPALPAASLPAFAGKIRALDGAQTILKALKRQKKRALSDTEVLELVADVGRLLKIFAKITKSKEVFVRLECKDDNGCVYWHQDCVPFRLVTTYRGPCTEWVHPELSDKTLRRKQADSKHAMSLTHHDVALFKGRGETEFGDALLGHPGIVHRSPRIEGSGVYRVVLVLDIPAKWHSE
jgi:hypothetical protein